MLSTDLQRVQMLFLRCVAGGVRKSTPRLLLLREFGCTPLVRSWLLSVCDLWNRVCVSGRDSLIYHCMLDNWDMRMDLSNGVKVWCFQFLKVLQHIGFDTGGLVSAAGAIRSLQRISSDSVLSTFDSWFLHKWSNLPPDPRAASSEQVLYSVYDQWFAPVRMSELEGDERFSTCPLHIQRTAGINAAHMSSLLRFRLGAHDLPVATGRWSVAADTGQRLPRRLRHCQHCASGSIGDEFHMIFECEFYNPVRSQFPRLFEQFGGHDHLHHSITTAGPYMARFMGQDKRLVAAFVHFCWLLRCHPNTPMHVLHPLSESELEVESDDILQVELADILPE